MPQTESLYTGRRINVRAIIYREGKILAVKHRRGDQAAPYYAVPGGGLDPRESLAECLTRELREETGITAKPGKLLFIQQFPSSRAGYEEELEFFFAVDNPNDFTDIDISQTTHGAQELALCEYIDPSQCVLYPEFLQHTDIAQYINSNQPVLPRPINCRLRPFARLQTLSRRTVVAPPLPPGPICRVEAFQAIHVA